MIRHDVRQALPADSETLETIMREAFNASYAHFMPQAYIKSWREADIASVTVNRNLHQAGVSILKQKPTGFIVAEDDFIAELWVSPKAQGKGVGTALLRWAESRLHKRGYNAVQLYCYGDNANAIAFYEKSGYETIKVFQSRHVAGGPVPVHILSKALLKAGR